MKYYTGVGSRETPQNILLLFKKTAEYLSKRGFILRSGHAPGADKAFEDGCDVVNGQKEIYLPWKNFEGSTSNLVVENEDAFEIAKKFHPYWFNLKRGGKKLQARNSHQVLGTNLNNPSNFVLCWTKEGKGKGGTGQAIRIANHYKIPVFDAGKYEDVKVELMKFLKKHLKLNNNIIF